MSSFRPDWTQSHHLLDIPVKTRILELYLKLGPQQHPSALSSLVLDSIRNEQESEGYDGGKIPSIMIRILQKLANKIQRLLDTVGNQRGVYGLHSDAQPGAKTRSDHQVQLVLMIRVFDELLDGLCPQLRVPVPSSNLTESEVDKFTPGLVHKKVVENADLYRKALFGGSLKEHILKIFHAEVDSENGGLSQEDLLVPTSSSDEHLCVWFDSVLGKLATHHGKQAAQHRFYHDLYLIAQGLVVMLKDRPTDSLPTKQVYYISATSTTLPFLPGRGRVLFVKEDTTGPKCLELALQRPSPFAYGSTQMSSTSRLIIVAICEILSQVEGRMVCVPRLDAKKYLDRVEQLPEKSQCWKWPSLGELLFPHENSLGPPRVPQLTVADPVSGSDIGGMATEPWLSAGGDTFDCGHTAAETRSHHLVGPPLHKDQSAAVDMPEPSCANIVSPPDTPPASELHSNVTAKHTFGVGQGESPIWGATLRSTVLIDDWAADDEEEPLAKRPRLAGCDSIDWNEGSAAQGTGPNSQDSVHESCPLDMNVDDLGHGLEAEVAPQIEVPEYGMLQENDQQGGEMGPSAGEDAGDFGTETGLTLLSEVSGLTLNDQLQSFHEDQGHNHEIDDERHASNAKNSRNSNNKRKRGTNAGARHRKKTKNDFPSEQPAASKFQREKSMFPYELEEDLKPTTERLETIARFSSPDPEWPLLEGNSPMDKFRISVPIPPVKGAPQPDAEVSFVPAQEEDLDVILKLSRVAREEKPYPTPVGLIELSEEECWEKKPEELQAMFKSNHMVIRPSAPINNSQWSDNRGRINLDLLAPPNRKFQVHNMSKRSTEPGMHQQVTEIGALNRILDHVNDSEHGSILNLLDCPDETGLGPKPGMIRSLESSEWAYTHTAHLQSTWKNMPTEVLRWFILTSGGAITMDHVDANGLATWIHIIKGGGKLWLLSLGPKSPEDDLFDNSKPLKPDPWASENPSFESLAEQHWWAAVYLPEGSTLIMQPYTVHLVLTLDGTLASGGHFYSSQHLNRTLHAYRLTESYGQVITNNNHPEAAILLHRMLLYAHQVLTLDQEGRLDIDQHMPLPYPIDELAALVYLVGTDPGQGSFLKYLEDKQGQEQAFKAQLAGKQLLQILPELHKRVELLDGKFKDWANRKEV